MRVYELHKDLQGLIDRGLGAVEIDIQYIDDEGVYEEVSIDTIRENRKGYAVTDVTIIPDY